jgi:hypothetical protein
MSAILPGKFLLVKREEPLYLAGGPVSTKLALFPDFHAIAIFFLTVPRLKRRANDLFFL